MRVVLLLLTITTAVALQDRLSHVIFRALTSDGSGGISLQKLLHYDLLGLGPIYLRSL